RCERSALPAELQALNETGLYGGLECQPPILAVGQVPDLAAGDAHAAFFELLLGEQPALEGVAYLGGRGAVIQADHRRRTDATRTYSRTMTLRREAYGSEHRLQSPDAHARLRNRLRARPDPGCRGGAAVRGGARQPGTRPRTESPRPGAASIRREHAAHRLAVG